MAGLEAFLARVGAGVSGALLTKLWVWALRPSRRRKHKVSRGSYGRSGRSSPGNSLTSRALGLSSANKTAKATGPETEGGSCMHVPTSTWGGASAYETAKAVDEYTAFHYADQEQILPYKCGPTDALEFISRCAALCAKYCNAQLGSASALDVGCAVGGASFALAKDFQKVVGVDFSHAFVEAAKVMKEQGFRKYRSVVEGDILRNLKAELPSSIDRQRVSFLHGDACALPADIGSYDAVLAANLLCRLPDPALFLVRMAEVVKPSGVLVLVSPYSWLSAFTPPDKWLGGTFRDGAPVMSIEGIKTCLSNTFELVHEQELPFLIREHSRKYQWGCSHATVWRRLAHRQ